MKHSITILAALLLVAGICRSQTSSASVTGNYIGQFTNDRAVGTINIRQNHKFILKTYDATQKLQRKVKGEWSLNGDKIVLKEKSGTVIVLEKTGDTWYISDKKGYSCLARFYQNRDPKEFWQDLQSSGC